MLERSRLKPDGIGLDDTTLPAPSALASVDSEAGDLSAIIYSIVVSCQRRGVDPLDYIRDVPSRLPTMSPSAVS